MAIAVPRHDADADVPAARAPGQFARHPKTGAPYVAHPTETTKGWPGTKAELIALCTERGLTPFPPEAKVTAAFLQNLLGPCPKRVQYGRPSGLGKQIENLTNLQKWAERMVSLGIVSDDELLAEGRGLLELDRDSQEFREAADAIAVKAKRVALAHLAAERGTHHHELTEDADLDRDPVARMAAGEDLGVPQPTQRALVAAWELMLATYDIEILAVEATCVDDVWHQAGTLDRIARLRRDITFVMPTGEMVTLPAGTILILDIKTGRLRLDDAGFVSHWRAYAVQLASYAQSVPYDPDTDRRGEWPWPIDQRWAVIAHLDVLAALDGEAVCRLVLVDLEAGRAAGALCVAAREWEKRTDVFSLPIDKLAVSVPVPQLESSDGGGTAYPAPPEPASGPVPPAGPDAPHDRRAALSARYQALSDEDKRRYTEAKAGIDTGDLDAVERLLDEVDAFSVVVPLTPVAAMVEARRPVTLDDLDQGAAVANEDFEPLRAAVKALDAPARSWLEDVIVRAGGAGVAMKATHMRSFDLLRGLVELARHGHDDDELARELAATALGDVSPFFATTAGQAVGILAAPQARTFAELCVAFCADVASVDLRLRPAAA